MSKYQNDDFLVAADIVHQLTHTSNKILDEKRLNDLKVICRNGNEFIERTHTLLLDCLKKKHSEIRYNAFQVCCALFQDYSYYRVVFMKDIKCVLMLTTEISYDLPLPPPKRAADDLKRLTLQTLKHWKDLYGNEHKGLISCYSFLISKIKGGDDSSDYVDVVSRQRTETENRRMQIVNYERIRLLRNEIADVKPEIQVTISSLDSCIRMLVPTLEEFFIVEPTTEDGNTNNNTSDSLLSVKSENSHRLESDSINNNNNNRSSTNQCTRIDITTDCDGQIAMKKTAENAIIIENARDQIILITNKYLPTVKKWLNIAIKASDDENFIKSIIDLKNELDSLLTKYRKIRIQNSTAAGNEDNGSDTNESDMEEVAADNNDGLVSADDIITSTILQFDFSAEHSSSCNSSLVPKDDSVETDRELKRSSISSPQISSTVEFDKTLSSIDKLRSSSIWECRAPLQNGKLCPRKDKIKCPFHGVIVARDKTGKCVNSEDDKKEQKLLKEKQLANPDWQDPTLLAEIKHATGVDLKMPERGKRTKRKRENDLTDINAFKNTPYYRLSKKIFKKRR